MSTDTAPNTARAIETASHLHPTPSWEVADHPVPQPTDEAWRFTPLDRLRGLHADAPFQPSTTTCDWDAPAGSLVRPVPLPEVRATSGWVPSDRTSARIMAEISDSLRISVEAEAELAEPIRVNLDGADAATTEAGHLFIEVGAHAKATIVLSHRGSASLAHVVELMIADGAQVTLITHQDWADDSVHLAEHFVTVGRDAQLKHIAISFGGDAVRLHTHVEYAGPGGKAELFGLYFGDAGQHLEHRLFVDHNQPQTESNVDYRGALQGEGAHAVWIGDVLIRKAAEGIETYESNKNLLLTDGCHADSVPNLEIETGEIAGAGHSSTTGRFDDEQLFYLRSRGISEEEARRLVVHGFFVDIIRRIGVPELEARLTAEVEAELEAVSARKVNQ